MQTATQIKLQPNGHIDKKQLWQDILERTGHTGSATGFMLNKATYIDSVEPGKVRLVFTSDIMRNIFIRQKKAKFEAAFSQVLGHPVRLLLGVTRQQIHEEYLPEGDAILQPSEHPGLSDEASVLMERYGDIMGLVDNHPLFKRATTPTEKGGAGIYPQVLTNKCKDYGVSAVTKALRYTFGRPSVINKRGFFLSVLENEQFGPKYQRTVGMVTGE